MTLKKRILITRSGDGGRQLTALLAAQGVAVIHYAPVRLSAMADQAATRAQVHQCLPVDVLVAPSAEALRQLASLLEPAQLGDLLIVVPGPGTAKIGAQLGFGRIRFPAHAGNSEQILALPELQDVAGARVLIAAAAGGRDLIETRLRARGATVRRLNVYRRIEVPPAPEVIDQLSLDTPTISLLASGGALLGLRQQLPQACWQAIAAQPMIAPSPRVAAMARAAGCARVFIAGGADDRSMLVALGTLCPSLATISYSVGS
jgi:uroporphyrinogen-III synthase